MPGIRSFIPPILFEPLLRLRRTLRSEKDPDAPYPSFEEALRSCGTAGYEEAQIVSTVVEKTRRQVHRLSTTAPTADRSATRLLLALLAPRHPSDNISVLDFGGAAGSAYFVIRSLLPRHLRLAWHVIDTPAMVRAAKPVLASDELFFHESLADAKVASGGVDLLYSSGAIQYVPEPISMLHSLLGLGARSVLLTRLGLRDSGTPLIGVQRSLLSENGPGPLPDGFPDGEVRYPVTILPRSTVDAAIRARYDSVVEFDDAEIGYRIGGEAIGMRGYWGRAD